MFSCGEDQIWSCKEGIDEFTKFSIETGSITPVKEEIVDITWGSMENYINLKPCIVHSETFFNDGSETGEMELKLGKLPRCIISSHLFC